MELLTLNISALNDFIFCPYSIYLHNVYNGLESEQFQEEVQVAGKNAHESIDEATHDTRKDILLGINIYSEKYGLQGKIDMFDVQKQKLTERKKLIKTVYDGYVLQIYAQYFCLVEMGFTVTQMGFHSLADNRHYIVPIPNNEKTMWFENHLQKIRQYRLEEPLENINQEKCRYCIYQPLCDQTELKK